MNKYQDALRRCESDFEDRIDNNNILMLGRMDIESLEELVDLATPKKPTGWNNECWGCGEQLNTYEEPPKYCPNCGQKVDWEVE